MAIGQLLLMTTPSRFSTSVKAALASGLRTGFAFPVEHDGHVVGVIDMFRSRAAVSYTHLDVYKRQPLLS